MKHRQKLEELRDYLNEALESGKYSLEELVEQSKELDKLILEVMRENSNNLHESKTDKMN
ncbi:MAG: aspartyl-phosphate phosphatase Spo0E family protein [Clostridiales bacterium]|nr:aspartyl-phosphate phosphatase Spo0E family protein [Clostridiales bacterium]